MARAPYLHPSQRNLASDGPSSHKNEYHVGVLQGNWVEDRESFVGAKKDPPKLDATSIAQASFKKAPPGMKCKPDAIPLGETDRRLLFGHGCDFDQTNYTTTNELTYTNLSEGDSAIKSNVAMLVTGDSQRNSLAARKRAQWAEENDPKQDRYVTQGKATIDATANYMKDHKPPPAACQKKHAVTSGELNATWRNTGLRGTVELSRTPLDKR